ncbi:unnamed protein product [Lupinus luteus]|uniref:Uncharacterized protein n=1 Tax=Lupinus luteus TaxID=3873 RepID=A0AAV1X1L7_LUPLU
MDELQGGRKEEGKNHAFRKVAIGHRSTPGYKPGQPMNVEHTTMPPVLISWKSPAEERAVGQAESGHHLVWEWLSPYASFDESTPVASFLEVACQPRFPSLKTMLLTNLNGLGMPAEMELGANLYFPGACLAPTSKENAGAEKEPAQPLQESFAWQRLGKPYRKGEPHAGKLARVVLAGDPGILY